MKIRSILAILCMASALSLPSARAQDQAPAKPDAPAEAKPEAPEAPASVVAGITVPDASRVTGKAIVDRYAAQLKTLAAQARLPLGEPEVWSWGDDKGLKTERVKALTEQTVEALKAAGYVYSTVGKPGAGVRGVATFFTVTNDEKKRMLMGYWVAGDTMLILTWAALEDPNADAFPAEPAKPAPPAK